MANAQLCREFFPLVLLADRVVTLEKIIQVTLPTIDSLQGSRLRHVMLELFADVHGLAATGPADEALVDGIRNDEQRVARRWFAAVPSLEVLVLRLDGPFLFATTGVWECPRTSQNWVRSGAGDFRPVKGGDLCAALKSFQPLPISRFVIPGVRNPHECY